MVWWQDGRNRNFKCGQQNPQSYNIQMNSGLCHGPYKGEMLVTFKGTWRGPSVVAFLIFKMIQVECAVLSLVDLGSIVGKRTHCWLISFWTGMRSTIGHFTFPFDKHKNALLLPQGACTFAVILSIKFWPGCKENLVSGWFGLLGCMPNLKANLYRIVAWFSPAQQSQMTGQ